MVAMFFNLYSAVLPTSFYFEGFPRKSHRMRVTLTTMTAAKFEQNDIASYELNVIQRHMIRVYIQSRRPRILHQLGDCFRDECSGLLPPFLLERRLVSGERHSLSRSFDRFGQSAALPFERRCTWGIEGRERGREREDHRYEYDRIVDEMAAALPPSVLPWAPEMRVHFD